MGCSINLKKNYTVKELIEIYGPLWSQHLGLCEAAKQKNKPEIFAFEDFNKKTQEIYKKIYVFIIKKNLNNKNIKMWAIGSRILGTWRTREESEQLHGQKKKIKYSDYDFLTDASFLPCNKEIESYLDDSNIKVDGRCFPEGPNLRKVLIPFDNL